MSSNSSTSRNVMYCRASSSSSSIHICIWGWFINCAPICQGNKLITLLLLLIIIKIKNILKIALSAFCDYTNSLFFFDFKRNLGIKSEHDNGECVKLHLLQRNNCSKWEPACLSRTENGHDGDWALGLRCSGLPPFCFVRQTWLYQRSLKFLLASPLTDQRLYLWQDWPGGPSSNTNLKTKRLHECFLQNVITRQ